MNMSLRRILVVEDDPTVRESIVAYLEDCDYLVEEAEDGAQGLRCIAERAPDVVLTDLRMPHVTGQELVDRVRLSHPDLPLIVISGTGELQDAVRVFKRGAWDYVTKPILDLAVLEHAICRALERADLIRENRLYRENLERANRELEHTLLQLREDEAAARHVQFQLLPDERLRMGPFALSRALRPSELMSGDFVDYFPINDHHIGFYILDVSGHGISSAFITVLVRGFIHERLEAHRYQSGGEIIDPGALMTQLNDYLVRQRLGKHLTMFYGVADISTSEIAFTNGGQFPYPLLVTPDGVTTLDQRGPALGLFPSEELETHRLILPPQSRLVVVSDGIFEILTFDTLTEKERALAEHAAAHGSASELSLALGVTDHLAPPDDVALLVFSRE